MQRERDCYEEALKMVDAAARPMQILSHLRDQLPRSCWLAACSNLTAARAACYRLAQSQPPMPAVSRCPSTVHM